MCVCVQHKQCQPAGAEKLHAGTGRAHRQLAALPPALFLIQRVWDVGDPPSAGSRVRFVMLEGTAITSCLEGGPASRWDVSVIAPLC